MEVSFLYIPYGRRPFQIVEQLPGPKLLNKAFAVLTLLCNSPSGMTLTDLTDVLRLPKSTAYRILQSLVEQRFALQDPDTKIYKAGLRMIELAHQVLAHIELRIQSRAEVEELSCRFNETVHLGVLDRDEIIYIDKHDSQKVVRMYSAIGNRSPLHCTGVGKVLLADFSEETLERIVRKKGLHRYTENTITSFPELKKHLAMVRKKGYAIDDGEHEREITCVASPIRGYGGKVIGAISLTVPISRMSRDDIEDLSPVVMDYADRISRKMGYTQKTAALVN